MLKQNFKKKFKTFLVTTVIISMLAGCATTSDMDDTSIHQYNGAIVDIDENINKLVDNTDEIDVLNDDAEIENDETDENIEDNSESIEMINDDIENVESTISTTNTPSVSDNPITEENETTENNENAETILEDDVDNDMSNSVEDDMSNDENIEKEEGKEENDIWEISLNYCEREKGKINIIDDRKLVWDASNGSYEIGTQKEVILQINYNKRDTTTAYKAGELIIKVPNLFYQCENSQIKADVSLTSNTTTQEGYDFDSVDSKKNLYHPNNNDEYFYFTNPKDIVTSITGSLQIVYVLTSLGDNEKPNISNVPKFYPEEYDDSCERVFSSDIYATLNDELKTESLKFEYYRKYEHPWKSQLFTIRTTIEGADIPDGIVDNKRDYIAIKYTYYIPEHDYGYVQNKNIYDSTYPYYRNITARLVTDFPEECIILNYLYEVEEDNHYEADYYFTYRGAYRNLGIKPIIVLYPRDKFNLENDNYLTTNNVDLYVEHESIGFVYNNSNNVELNIGDFDIDWPTDGGGGLWCDLYNYAKHRDTDSNPDGRKYYSDIIRIKPNRSISEYPREYQHQYSFAFIDDIKNKTTDVYLGVDKIFITGQNNEYRLLNDDEYFISCIEFPNTINDAYGNVIPADTYEIELYLRYANSKEYVLYDTFMNVLSQSKSHIHIWDYLSKNNDDQVVGYYFKIKDVKNGITKSNEDDGTPLQTFFFYVMTEDCADYGNIYPFCYIDAIDKNGNTCLNQTEDNYIEFAKTMLAPLDLQEKGYYLGRGTDRSEFNPLSKITFANKLGAKIETEKLYDNKALQKFFGKSTIHLTKGDNIKEQYTNYFPYLPIIPETQKIKGFECYNLLPYGMKLESSIDEIKNSMQYFNTSDLGWNFTTYYNDVEMSIVQKLKDVCDVEIIENYNNTERTMLHIKFDLGDDSVAFSSWNVADIDYLNFTYYFSISYDAYLENSTYTNNVYADWVTNKFLVQNSIKDDGSIDVDIIDVNCNGKTDDELAFATSSITLSDMVSSQQGIFKEVKTDTIDDYQSGVAESSLDADYEYKLTIKTGSTYVTDLILYDNLEEAYSDNDYWKGNFVDIDTSYAESEGYIVKVYYSENIDASALSEDKSWQEYTDDIDKSKVKSLAFQYLDENGNSAILPSDTETYLIIKMHSPTDINFNNTYNNSYVEWHAIDSQGKIIPNIINLNSNIVSVKLPYIDVMLPFTGGNGNSWLYIIIAFTTTIGFILLYIAKKYKKQ